MTPAVSVIMPVYNQERYLMAAVESVLVQTYRDFELLIIDDGSTDGTIPLLRAIRDPRVRVIYAEHAGFTAALARGITEARARWIARMDSDDVCTPDHLERQMRFLAEHPGCVFVASVFGLVTPNDRYLEPTTRFDWRALTPRDITLATVSFADPSTVFCRETALAVGLYDPDFENEKPLWYKMLGRGMGAVCGEPTYYLRWRMGTFTQTNRPKRWDDNMAVRRRYDPGTAAELTGRQRPEGRDAIVKSAARCLQYYLLAGDFPAAWDVAWKGWRAAPTAPDALKLLLRMALRRNALRPGTSRRLPSPYCRIDAQHVSVAPQGKLLHEVHSNPHQSSRRLVLTEFDPPVRTNRGHP